jgi:hypothetical protein
MVLASLISTTRGGRLSFWRIAMGRWILQMETGRTYCVVSTLYDNVFSRYSRHMLTNIFQVGMMNLSEEELVQVGGSPDSVRLPSESGGGYLAYLSSHHMLHCLYLLHQSLHQEYYSQFSVVWKLAPERRLSHWDHCIETLRQYVTCDADTTVVTHDWYDEIDSPVPNQGNPRRCADWDAHFQWQLERQAPAPKGPILKPSDTKGLPIVPSDPPPGFMEMYNA